MREIPWLGWLLPMRAERRLVIGFVALAAFLFVPWLGATGFWDPWEPHYGEVAREMISRGDYIHPWWESAWFFSKPALDLWLMASGMLVANTNGPERWTGIYTEWCVRLPYAAITALGAVLLFVMANRLLTRRSAVLGTFAILTSPLFVFLARQAVPDPVFVGLLEGAMACLMIVLFEDEEPREGWAAAFYCFVGFATLSKGLLGFALPGAVAFFYCLVTGEWHRLRRLHIAAGSLIVLAICAPWYGTMFAFDGRDDEGKTFFERFIIHDHFKRLALGVHTTTPGRDVHVFRRADRVRLLPLGVRISRRRGRRRARAAAASEHARAGDALPALLVPDRVRRLRVFRDQVPPLRLSGACAAALLLRALARAGARGRPAPARGNAVCRRAALRAGGARPGDDPQAPHRHVRLQLRPAVSGPGDEPAPDLRGALLCGAGGRDLALAVRSRGAALVLAARARLEGEAPCAARPLARRMQGAPLVSPESAQDRNVAVFALVSLAIAFAVFCGWFQWRRLSPHWTQRDLFWEYYHQSTPDEPIAAYQMNWRGETFYSRNTVRQVGRPGAPSATLAEFMNGPGPRKWFLVEQSRINGLRQALGTARMKVVESRNNKFALAVVERPDEKQPQQPMDAQPEKATGPMGAPP